jgi:hypothetical protein
MSAPMKGLPLPENGEANIECESIRPQIKTTTRAFSGNGATDVKPDLLATHYCTCRLGVICVFCLKWAQKIRAGNVRRAESLRHQSLGRCVAGRG